MNTAKERLEQLNALANGKKLQFFTKYGGWVNSANTLEEMMREALTSDYRIKPEPREFWLVKRKDNKTSGTIRTTQKEAETTLDYFNTVAASPSYELVHVIEQM